MNSATITIMSNALSPAPSRQRALVVEPDQELRQRLTLLLRDYGLEVADCADVAMGRELFADHRLVVAPLNGDNTAMKEFVAWVRAEAGVTQPWIIALGVQHHLAPGETPAHYGVNDVLTGPVDTESLVKTLEAIGLGRASLPSKAALPAPPSYHRARPGAAAALTPVNIWDSASAHVLLEHFPAAVAILDKAMKYLAVNTRWVQQFQIPRLNLTGQNHYDIFPDLHPGWRALYEGCLAGDEKQTSDDVMLRPDGTEDFVQWEIQPWHESTGAVGGLVLTCKTVETAPALSPGPTRLEGGPQPDREAHSNTDPAFREMAEAAPFGMILLDDEAHVIYANPQHRAVLGFAAAEDEPIQSWLERACAGDDVFQKRALDEWWESVWRRRTSLTCSLRNAEGLVKDIEFRPAALSGDRLLLTIFDVTDARLDEQAVRTSEARYRGLFQQAPAALLMINPAGNITEVNPAFESLTGLPRHEARRAALGDFLSADAVTRLRNATHGGGSMEAFSTSLRHRSGSGTPVHVSMAVIRNGQGQPAFTACLFAPLPEAASSAAAWDSISPDWLFLLDADGSIIEHSTSRDFEALQADPAVLKGELLETALPTLAAPLPLDVMMERLLDSPGHETRCEYSISWPEETTPRRIEARLILLPGGLPARFGLTLRDVTRARSSNSLGAFNTTILEHLATAAILTNEKGRILHLNPAAEALLGYTTADLKDNGLYRIFRPGAPGEFSAELSRQLSAHRSWHTTTTFTRNDGMSFPGQVELTPAVDNTTTSRGFILLLRPQKQLAPTAPDSDHGSDSGDALPPSISLHRARNDLQILTSLMALQAEHTAEPAAHAALLSCRDRLAAVSLIYRLVRHEEDSVDFARFVAEIGRTLLDSHPRPDGKITIEPLFSGIFLAQRPAISLGLIVGELINASLTWSFADATAAGHIRMTLTMGNGEGVLIVRDNGQPLSESLRAGREATFSSKIIQVLADQMGGTLTILSDLENQVRLRFRLPD